MEQMSICEISFFCMSAEPNPPSRNVWDTAMKTVSMPIRPNSEGNKRRAKIMPIAKLDTCCMNVSKKLHFNACMVFVFNLSKASVLFLNVHQNIFFMYGMFPYRNRYSNIIFSWLKYVRKDFSIHRNLLLPSL